MTVMDEHQPPSGPVEEHRSRPRWSANKKMDAVLRLLPGEPLDQLSRARGRKGTGWLRGATRIQSKAHADAMTSPQAA